MFTAASRVRRAERCMWPKKPFLQVKYFQAQGVGKLVSDVFRVSKTDDELLGTNPGRGASSWQLVPESFSDPHTAAPSPLSAPAPLSHSVSTKCLLRGHVNNARAHNPSCSCLTCNGESQHGRAARRPITCWHRVRGAGGCCQGGEPSRAFLAREDPRGLETKYKNAWHVVSPP